MPLDAPHVPHHQEELLPVLAQVLRRGASPVEKPQGVGDGRREAQVVVEGDVRLRLGVRGHQGKGLLEGQGQVQDKGLLAQGEAGHLLKPPLQPLKKPLVDVFGDVGPLLRVKPPGLEAPSSRSLEA